MVMLQRSVVRKGLPVSVKKGKGLSLDLLLNFKWSKWTALVCDTGLVKKRKRHYITGLDSGFDFK